MDRYLDLNKAEPLPEGDDHLGDAGSNSRAGMSKANIRQGYSTMDVMKGDVIGGEKEEDDFYSFFDDSDKRGGFAGRPEGCER